MSNAVIFWKMMPEVALLQEQLWLVLVYLILGWKYAFCQLSLLTSLVFCYSQKYQPYASDPNLSGALASVLWELNLLKKHYNPAVSTMASGILTMGSANNQVYHSIISPQQAFKEFSREQELIVPSGDAKRSNNKRKQGNDKLFTVQDQPEVNMKHQSDENEVRKKLTEHFLLLRDISENQRLRRELDRTTLSLNLYEQYKKQKKKKGKTESLKV